MSFDSVVAPRVFISYCWTTPDHEEWVLQLATDMRQEGIDAILDKWDLGVGDDAYAFMERMVNDPTISKVVIVCDRMYVQKANERTGGVGTETQVLTPDLYGKREQTKYALLPTELGVDKLPCCPTYYKGRVHIDFTDTTKYAYRLEELVRWVFDKPLHKKPELGTPPSYVQDNVHEVDLGVRLHYQQAINAVRKHQPNAEAIVNDYLELVTTRLERLRVVHDNSEPIDEKVVRSIENFIPCRNELINLFMAIVQHHDTDGARMVLHRFFERLIAYTVRPESIKNAVRGDCDNYIFIVHELFLYLIAIALRQEAFDFATYMIVTAYYVESSNISTESTVSYSIFLGTMESLLLRKKRTKSNQLSIRADMLHARCIGTGLSCKDIMQADFVLSICHFARSYGQILSYWRPVTLVYARLQERPFEVFARSVSQKYYRRFQQLWGTGNVGLQKLMTDSNADHIMRLDDGVLIEANIGVLSNYENLATKL